MSIELSFRNDNILSVDHKVLWADVLRVPKRMADNGDVLVVSPPELETILRVGKPVIERTIEVFYRQQKETYEPKGYTVQRPSIWTAQFGTERQTDGRYGKVYSDKGYANGGIHYDKDEQQVIFWPHWEAVERAGFTPHVRGATRSGAWLMLRDDDYRD